jgi:hypothetical protein
MAANGGFGALAEALSQRPPREPGFLCVIVLIKGNMVLS